jgi:hypothetical protein
MVAEFNALSDKIANRSQAQQNLVYLAVVTAAALASFVISTPRQGFVAVVLCYLCSVLGALWLDHARMITGIGVYISSVLWPQIREVVDRRSLSTYEDMQRGQDSNRPSLLLLVSPLMGVFVLPAVAGLVYAFTFTNGLGTWIVWVTALLITIASVVYWVSYCLNLTVLIAHPTPYMARSAAGNASKQPSG